MKALLILILKIICTPLLIISLYLYILTSFIMWDKRYMELEGALEILWRKSK